MHLAGRREVDHPQPNGPWTEAEKDNAALLDLAIFEPWFLVQGITLAMAGWQYLSTARSRRRWTFAMAGGSSAISVFGIVLTITDSQASSAVAPPFPLERTALTDGAS
ncbi:hypothetical protein [Streptomyces sp. NPDC127098]|uniref:hypothetical protein n=1 Tax=Streptomyces sp. NPDC127098 TaxID=3347137 RepID=UPI003668BD4E